MKTSNYLIALAALTSFTLVGCSDNDFLGTGSGPEAAQGNGEITFATSGGIKTTRAGDITGKAAADILDNQFFVYGWKSASYTKAASVGTADVYGSPEIVFPYYLLTYQEGSAGSTESNTHSWEYVGNVSVPTNSSHVMGTGVNQTIKYWDYTARQYDFIAWDVKPGSTATYAVKDDGKSPWKPNWLEFKAPTADEASNIYFADKVTVINDDVANVNVANKYGGYVTFKFRNLTSKVRMALYETIPGYSVTDVKFYSAAGSTGNTAKTYLYSAATDIPTSGATINIKFSDGTAAGLDAIPENQAVANLASVTNGTNISFGTLTPDKPREYQEWYTAANETDKNKWLGRVSNDPSFATGMWDGEDIDASTEEGKLRNHYTYVFPKAASELCLKVDYRLKSLDGSNDDIIVTGANAIIPASFCEWKSNFAYTYLFKISDNTNGSSGSPTSDPAGLYPITFDACVVDMVDGNAQETITELANASVTTYQFGTVVTDNDEYVEKDIKTGTPAYIYVTASLMDGSNPSAGLATLASTAAASQYKTELFLVNNFGDEKTTEEAVANYKNNKIVLTDITSCLTFTTNIPATQTMDKVAKNFDGTNNKVAYFAPKAGYTYAVRFTDNTTPTAKQIYKVIKVDGALAAARTYAIATKPSASAVAENAILDKAVTVTESYTNVGASSASGYNVLGAGPLLSATNFTFVDDTDYGKYDAVANVAATTKDDIVVTFSAANEPSDGTNKLATKAYEFAPTTGTYLEVYPDGASVNKATLNLGTSAAGDVDVNANFTIVGLNGATGVSKGAASNGVLTIVVDDDARGDKLHSLTYSDQNAIQATQSITQVVAAKTIYVDQWSLGVDKKYVNFKSGDANFTTTSELTLSLTDAAGATTAKDAETTGKIIAKINPKDVTETVGKATVTSATGVGKYTVEPTAATNFKIAYTNATPIDITTTQYSWVLESDESTPVVQSIGTTVPNGTYYLTVKDGTTPTYVSTLSIDHGTITKTGTTGKYKVTVTGGAGATISLNYKGIANYIQTKYVTAAP